MDELTKSVVTRLRRIEGQVQGLQRMLESGRECEELLTQVMAVRSSIDQVGILLMEHHLERCILDELPADSNLVRELNLALKTWARFGLVPGARSELPAIDRPVETSA
ncbi:MAG TPA: metal-sensitive transcriptional regulator [Dehalococcoidia bacterium]|nr:metal-sensitive transcriptional regulator [Dehalococcoidia bacterium]